MISNCRTVAPLAGVPCRGSRPCRHREDDDVAPGSIDQWAPSVPPGHVGGLQVVEATWMPSSWRPGTVRSLGLVAPPARTSRRTHRGSRGGEQRDVGADAVPAPRSSPGSRSPAHGRHADGGAATELHPSASNWVRRRSSTAFSILNSGSRSAGAPGRSARSKTTTSCGRVSCWAHARPPARSTTATRVPSAHAAAAASPSLGEGALAISYSIRSMVTAPH